MDIPAVRTVADLESVEIEEILREDFEGDGTRFDLHAGCETAPDGPRGSVLACSQGGQGRASLTLPVSGNRGYRIRLQARRTARLGYSVTATEWSHDAPLRIFQFPEFRGVWKPYELWLYSTPETRRLEIVIQSRQGQGRLWLDDLVIDRVNLTPDQELSLLKGQNDRSPAAEASRGMVKRGRLLPLGDPEASESPAAGNYTRRDALLAPPPTDIRFRLKVPRDARLSVAYGLAKESEPGGAARFRVLAAESGGEPRVLLDEPVTFDTDPMGWHWRENEIDLASLEGREIELTLETRALGESRRTYALWGSPEIYSARRPDDPPNVILVAVDTLRADRISCYGNRPGVSPHIDSLAADGVLFERTISYANWTLYSFLSLFTARNVLGLRGNLSAVPDTTLAESFQAAGWTTAGILYKPPLFDNGFDRGYDVFLNAPRYRVRAEENLEQALEWLERNRHRRFFLFLHFDDPHQPFCQPDGRIDQNDRDRLQRFGLTLPIVVSDRHAASVGAGYPTSSLADRDPCKDCRAGGVLTPEFKSLAKDLYDNAVSYVDESIGAFLSALKREGLYDDAVIAFVSDHGEALWAHQEQFAHAGENLHDELVRVPLIVKPQRGRGWARGTSVASQVRLFDLAPTLLELAGIDSSHLGADSESLVPALRSPAAARLPDRPAFSVSQSLDVISLRHGGFKYIRYLPSAKSRRADLEEELFDLSGDPSESVNLAPGDEPRVLDSMRLAMDEFLLAKSPGRVVLVIADQPETIRRIRLHWDREVLLAPFPYPTLRPVESADGSLWESPATASRRVALLAAFETDPAAELTVTVETDAERPYEQHFEPLRMPVYQEGSLAQILGGRGVGAYVFAGRAPGSSGNSQLEPIDARQLRALKALGYVE